MREAARSVASEVVALGAGGTFAARVERDIRVELSSRRLAALDIGDAPWPSDGSIATTVSVST